MSAQIFNLAAVRQSAQPADGPHESELCRNVRHAARASLNGRDLIENFEFWSGASKERYVHTVYNLFECPELPQANYMLVRRAADGSTDVLQIGHTCCNSGSENLAMIRHSAAVLGANEVHVHFLPHTDKARSLVEYDLRAGQFGSLSAQPADSLH